MARLPAVVLPLRRDLAVRELDPRLPCCNLSLTLLVLTDTGLFLLEDDVDICNSKFIFDTTPSNLAQTYAL